MVRVGANQQSARDARANYVYRQEQTIRMRRGNGKMAREQHAEYVVTPGKQGGEKQLAKFQGKYEFKGKYVPYDNPDFRYRDLDIDGDLIHDMAQDMMNDEKSRDGIGQDLFPLTAGEQKKYDFRLVGTEIYRGRSVYRVAFDPRKGSEDDGDWKGEALIDAREYQPVLVTTSLAEKIPALVKVLLGTDIKGLGFSVTYQRFGDGVWFPVSYGASSRCGGYSFTRERSPSPCRTAIFRKPT